MNHMKIVMKHKIKKLSPDEQQDPVQLAFVFSSMDAKIRGNMRQQMWYKFSSNEIITLFTKKLEYPHSISNKIADLYLRAEDQESLSDFFTHKVKFI